LKQKKKCFDALTNIKFKEKQREREGKIIIKKTKKNEKPSAILSGRE